MELGLCLQVLYHLPFERALAVAAELGFTSVELPVDGNSPFFDLEQLAAGGWRPLKKELAEAGLTVSALSNHQESQLLLGPHGEDTDGIFLGTPEEKMAFAQSRLRLTMEVAARLEVGVVVGFTGCQDYSRWFPWPLPDGYERMIGPFRQAIQPVLHACEEFGVDFAHECHPRQFAYNLETAYLALKAVDGHPRFRFNFDPANLLLAGMDPVVFAAELGDRIAHVHAKDGELVAHHAARSGLLAHGAWHRSGRGFRFRVPGWGQLDWRRLITELHLVGFHGCLAVEHEDPTMARLEGLRQARDHLAPLILHERPEVPRWW